MTPARMAGSVGVGRGGAKAQLRSDLEPVS